MKLVTMGACVALAIAGVAAAITAREPDAGAPEVSAAITAREADASAPELFAAAQGDLCTTLGQLQMQAKPWRVESPKFRAFVKGSSGRHVALGFRFLGETEERSRLKSGAEQAQLGLKLLSRDTCNVLYVMWRHSPRSELVVSVKRNAAEHEHSGCENRGYVRLRPESASPVPRLEPGQVHELRADVVADTLTVHVDEHLVWDGKLEDNVLELRGSAGIRSDNVRFELLELKTEQGASSGEVTCGAAPEDAD